MTFGEVVKHYKGESDNLARIITIIIMIRILIMVFTFLILGVSGWVMYESAINYNIWYRNVWAYHQLLGFVQYKTNHKCYD